MKINQKYIAERLNVSRVTVTKALLDHPDISDKTRTKIKTLAEELGYIPNKIAQNLKTRKTNTIGIIMPQIDHSFFSKAIESMYACANELGYQIVLMVSFEDESTELRDIKSLLAMNVDGILIDTTAYRNHGGFDLIAKHKVPFLLFDRKLIELQYPGIFFNDFKLSYDLTKRVLSYGYKRTSYISGPNQLNISSERMNGYLKALDEFQLIVPKSNIIISELSEKGGYDAMLRIANKCKMLPEVLFCVNDSIAIGVYKACQDLQIKIPNDLSVVGFGNIRISTLLDPPLSTVDLPVEQAGRIAIQQLVLNIEKKSSLETTYLSGDIVIRESIKEFFLT